MKYSSVRDNQAEIITKFRVGPTSEFNPGCEYLARHFCKTRLIGT